MANVFAIGHEAFSSSFEDLRAFSSKNQRRIVLLSGSAVPVESALIRAVMVVQAFCPRRRARSVRN